MGRRIPVNERIGRVGRVERLAWPRLSLGVLPLLTLLTLSSVDCYSTGDGTAPPLDKLYYPVGLQVSAGGTVLYAVNSDFDLQYNGGTLQSYDLTLLRRDVKDLIAAHPCDDTSLRDPTATLGETCAPPVESSSYVRDSATTRLPEYSSLFGVKAGARSRDSSPDLSISTRSNT